MKLIIDIPEDIFEKMKSNTYFDEFQTRNYFQIFRGFVRNGTPIQTVTTAEEAEAYPISDNIPITKEEQENNCRIVREFLRDIAQAKDLPICKECKTCKHCMMNKKSPKITWEKGYPLIFCARHHEHFAPNDTCEFWMKR